MEQASPENVTAVIRIWEMFLENDKLILCNQGSEGWRTRRRDTSEKGMWSEQNEVDDYNTLTKDTPPEHAELRNDNKIP